MWNTPLAALPPARVNWMKIFTWDLCLPLLAHRAWVIYTDFLYLSDRLTFTSICPGCSQHSRKLSIEHKYTIHFCVMINILCWVMM